MLDTVSVYIVLLICLYLAVLRRLLNICEKIFREVKKRECFVKTVEKKLTIRR